MKKTKQVQCTIDSLVKEIVTTCSLHAPAINEELVVLKQSSSSHQTSEESGEPVKKKCMLEKLLGTTFSESTDNSVTVSLNAAHSPQLTD